MSAYHAILADMMEAIMTRDLSAASRLCRDKKGLSASEQLAIYIDSYRLRLREVTEATYPALLHYLGKARFDEYADAYIEATPSRAFNIDHYPIAFAAHMKGASEDRFAQELAAAEAAIAEVYSLEETPALAREWIAKQTEASLAGAKLPLRNAAHLLALTYPVNEYIHDFSSGANPQKPLEKNSYLLIFRHNNLVQRLALNAAEYRLLSILNEGKSLAEALEDERFISACDETVAADFGAWFARWVEAGCLRQPI